MSSRTSVKPRPQSSVADEARRSPKEFFAPLLPLTGSIVLLTLAFAPVSQFYLAYIGLIPWLLFVRTAPSQKSAFFWSWIGGTLFFSANMWWMWNISGPGMIALMVYCGLYFGFAALVIRGMNLLNLQGDGPITNAFAPFGSILSVAIVWTACEWLRGNLMTGLPWLFLGHTQTPFLIVCQIADVCGAYGVSFFLVTINVLIALAWIHRRTINQLIPAAVFTGILTGIVASYGLVRMSQTPHVTSPGPVVGVVQPSYPQSNDGSKSATIEERLHFHRMQTQELMQERVLHLGSNFGNEGRPDLIVWSETMMPWINHQTLEVIDKLTAEDGQPRMPRQVYDILVGLVQHNKVALLTGGEYAADWKNELRDGQRQLVPHDRRNSAYFFDKDGSEDDSDGHRYDKIHLVPFGEFIPFKHSIPWLYNIFVKLGPQYYEDYELQSGDPKALTLFELAGPDRMWRFATPICFEDIDSRICAAMLCPTDRSNRKRADFLVNITNDGWFKANQNAQHLQAATFRAIENRVPLVRCVNTGISGFIDSNGRASNLIPARTEGHSLIQLQLDSRLTIYTRFGDVFAAICIAISALLALVGITKKISRRAHKE